MIKKYFRRFPHALRGITYALKHDFGFCSQAILAILVGVLAYIFLNPLSHTELLFLILSVLLILITELQNSALETSLDRLHPELHDNIKQSKDMAAAAVLLAGMFLATVLSYIIIVRLG